MNDQVAALTAAEVVSAGWVCVNPDSFAGYLFWSAPTGPGTLFYLLVANAVMGLVWNIANVIRFLCELHEFWCKITCVFGFHSASEESWEDTIEVDAPDATEVDAPEPPLPPPPPPALPLNFLRDSYVMRPVQNYHKIHLFSGCAHIQNHHVESRRICRDCVQEVLKKTR